MRLNQDEQMSLDALKNFLSDWGKYIALFVAAIIIIYVADSGWNWYQNSSALEAAKHYQEFNTAFDAKNINSIYRIADSMENNYPRSEYTAMASMLAAKTAKSKLDNTNTEKYLNFVINNSKDNGLVDMARLRLADVYIDSKKFNQVLPLLMAKHDKSFDALYYSKRGDLHVAQGNLDEARTAYKTALKMAGDNQEVSQIIQMRLDVLGGGTN